MLQASNRLAHSVPHLGPTAVPPRVGANDPLLTQPPEDGSPQCRVQRHMAGI
jgi:hypothetical protein